MSCPSSLRPTAIVALCVTPFLACVAPRPRDSYRPEVASRDYLHSRGFVGEVQQGEVRRQEVLSIGETVYAAAPIEGGCLFAGGDRVASRRAWVARWENSRGVVWQQRLPDMGLVDSIAQVSSGLYAVSGEARPGYDLGITWVSHEGEAERFRRFGDYTPDGGLKSGAVDRGGILAVGPRGELFLAGAGDLRAYVVRIGGRFLTWESRCPLGGRFLTWGIALSPQGTIPHVGNRVGDLRYASDALADDSLSVDARHLRAPAGLATAVPLALPPRR